MAHTVLKHQLRLVTVVDPSGMNKVIIHRNKYTVEDTNLLSSNLMLLELAINHTVGTTTDFITSLRQDPFTLHGHTPNMTSKFVERLRKMIERERAVQLKWKIAFNEMKKRSESRTRG